MTILLMSDIAEFKKNDKDNTKRNLMIAGGLLGAGILGTVAVKSYLRNGKLVKNYKRTNLLAQTKPQVKQNKYGQLGDVWDEVTDTKVINKPVIPKINKPQLLLPPAKEVKVSKLIQRSIPPFDEVKLKKVIPSELNELAKQKLKLGHFQYLDKIKNTISDNNDDLIEYSKYLDDLEEFYKEGKSNAPKLSAIIHSRGWLKPTTVNDKTFEKLANSDEYIRLYRGVPDSKYANLNNHYMGRGQYGSGIYFSDNKESVLKYSNNKEENIIEVLIPKNNLKRAIGSNEMMLSDLEDVNRNYRKLYQTNDDSSRNITADGTISEKLALLGFDYKFISKDVSSNNINEYIIINPSIMTIKKKSN